MQSHKVISEFLWRRQRISPPAKWTPPDQETADRLVRAGCLRPLPASLEPEPAEPRPRFAVPTLEEVTARGYTLRAAHGIVAEQAALAAGKSANEAQAIKQEAMDVFEEVQSAGDSPAADKVTIGLGGQPFDRATVESLIEDINGAATGNVAISTPEERAAPEPPAADPWLPTSVDPAPDAGGAVTPPAADADRHLTEAAPEPSPAARADAPPPSGKRGRKGRGSGK